MMKIYNQKQESELTYKNLRELVTKLDIFCISSIVANPLL